MNPDTAMNWTNVTETIDSSYVPILDRIFGGIAFVSGRNLP